MEQITITMTNPFRFSAVLPEPLSYQPWPNYVRVAIEKGAHQVDIRPAGRVRIALNIAKEKPPKTFKYIVFLFNIEYLDKSPKEPPHQELYL